VSPVTGKKYLVLWCAIPAAATLLYPFLKDLHDGLKWLSIALSLLVMFFSIVIHEVCHGLASLAGGDQTAKSARRLTLNPLNHVSVVGSILLPLVLFLTKAPALLGWAKPVPLNPMNLREYPRDQIFCVLAGPLSNLALAYCSFLLLLGAGLMFKVLNPDSAVPIAISLSDPITIGAVPFESLWFVLFHLLNMGIFINISLGVFNLIPFPPLDGFWLLKAVFPPRVTAFLTKIQIWGFVLIIIAMQTKLFTFFLYPIIGLTALSIGIITAFLR
jgi:Zn-dependent protease